MSAEGLGVEGRQVDLIPVGRSEQIVTLGTCDASGRVVGDVPAMPEVHVRVGLIINLGVVHPEAVIQLEPGSDVHRSLTFQVAKVRFEFPQSVQSPDSGTMRLSFTSEEGQVSPADVLF